MHICKLALIVPFLSAPALAQDAQSPQPQKAESEQRVTLLVGADYVTGDLDGQDYETTSVSAGVAAQVGRFSLSASIPYLKTSAPEELIVSQGGLFGTPLFAQPTTQTNNVTREGIGDLALQAGYQLPLGSVNAFIAGNVKVPTASREKALGTGEVDYGVSGQLSRRFGEVIPFVSAGYTITGEPEGFDVRNTVSGSAGSHFLLGQKSSATLSYNYEQSATQNVSDRQSVGVGFATGLSSQLQLGINARAGLSDDAPDASVGLNLGLGF